jgi:hypothetical protein
MKRIVVELEDSMHQEIKAKAVRLSKTMREIFTELLEKWLKQK